MCAPREARRTMYRDVVRPRLRVEKTRKCVSRVVRRSPVLLQTPRKDPCLFVSPLSPLASGGWK